MSLHSWVAQGSKAYSCISGNMTIAETNFSTRPITTSWHCTEWAILETLHGHHHKHTIIVPLQKTKIIHCYHVNWKGTFTKPSLQHTMEQPRLQSPSPFTHIPLPPRMWNGKLQARRAGSTWGQEYRDLQRWKIRRAEATRRNPAWRRRLVNPHLQLCQTEALILSI